MADVAYRGASRVFAGTPPVKAVDQLDLEISDGEFLVLVGPSGSGKSTALRMLAGLEDIDEGAIQIGGRDVTHTPPKGRDIAMVFQSYALYPHMTVAENMGFALKLRRIPKDQIKAKVDEAARMLDLTPYLDRKPKALSGGQRQRVAMGRAIVREPSVFLMDEPLSNLDAKLRVETRANIAALQQRLDTTTIYVTHDQVEAMTMGHRVAVLKDGLLQQCDTPRTLYDAPANAFVAGFMGSPAMNLKTATLHPDGAHLDGLTIPLTTTTRTTLDTDTITIGIRPENLHLTTTEPGITLTVDLVEELGADAYVYGTTTADTPERFIVRVDSRTPPTIGQQVTATLTTPDHTHLFHPTTGNRITTN
ncbi:ABC transporter ATP-binding protein [Actinoalloteichus hoggarensis]|uniref:sn-glycerol-3-phosphate import ATP-binding protein UgpC n=1 Tax=Actinoalloteichus hoggarensis TaxID=1470176 RepID=A0A221VXM9_9PSEU|nr:sn-glycerol-3-phosphate ABC transporter ATP-binding protein UgpC [Actinoalloteichus hoggarensis]ASO18011.1 sn-glycerol-3-phosphate import ATP-binding protein UgpC [Actinoalloteichus hoggarensis]ASO21902.1 sn-glycerol-3-phosphate import ATP-binding protein UgpC [Actinoalloteichus hoggarensis]